MATDQFEFEGFSIDDPGVQAYLLAMRDIDAEDAQELAMERAWQDAQEAASIDAILQTNDVWQAGIRYVHFVRRSDGEERAFLTIGCGPDLRAMYVVGRVPQISYRVHPSRRRASAFGALHIDPDSLANEYLTDRADEDKLAENLLQQAIENQALYERYMELQRAAGRAAFGKRG